MRRNVNPLEENGSKLFSQGSSSRLPRFDEKFLKDTTSFFFSNLPDKWSSKDLWFLFSRYGAGLGRIADVFIPGKSDKRGGCFGFVKFKEVKDVKAMLQKLNMIWLGSFKLRVSLAKARNAAAGRSFRVLRNSRQNLWSSSTNRTNSAPLRSHSRNKSWDPANRGFPLKSYKEVLLENQSFKEEQKREVANISSESAVVLDINDSDWEWLKECAVGLLNDFDVFPVLQDSLWDFGLMVKIIPMGGKLVLLKPEDNDLLLDFIQEAQDVWQQWFLSLNIWSPSAVPDERFTWVKVSGLPLHAWNLAGFKAVGDAIGTFVAVDSGTNNRLFLDTAKILISVPIKKIIIHSFVMSINQVQYSIHIKEDAGPSNYWWVLKSAKSDDKEDDESRFKVDSDFDENSCFWIGADSNDKEQSLPNDEEMEIRDQCAHDGSVGPNIPLQKSSFHCQDKENSLSVESLVHATNPLENGFFGPDVSRAPKPGEIRPPYSENCGLLNNSSHDGSVGPSVSLGNSLFQY
ncbi:hypothetical protein REPUB_Repub19eG0110800 [Reevesia pubescens]